MILGRNRLILLFDTESQNSSKQIWIVMVGTKYLSFINFFNFVFKRLKHLINHFWFWWYVIQQSFTKIFNLLHIHSKEFFCLFHVFAEIFFNILFFFQRDINGLQGVGCKTGVGSFGIDSSKMLLFCSTNLVASKACINSAFLRIQRNSTYNFLKHIRNSPKKVEIQDMETGEIIIYSSMYKAAKTFNQQSRLISA